MHKPRFCQHLSSTWFSRFLSKISFPITWLFHYSKSLYHNRKQPANPSRPITKRNRKAILGAYLVHLLPIAATIVLLFLNFSNLFFEDVGVVNQNIRLNSLQCAAKIHEVLISLSLSAMVLHYVQYELLNGKGVPLGCLLAPFQVNNLASLWNPGFWATTGPAGGMKLRRFLLITIIGISVLLATIVGPSSAILMVPSIGSWNYKIDKSFADGGIYVSGSNKTTRPPEYYIMASESTIWPRSLSNATSFQPECNSTADSTPYYCPLGGYSTLVGLMQSITDPSELYSWNFTIRSPSVVNWNRYLSGIYLSSITPFSYTSLSVAGTTSILTADLLGYIAFELLYDSSYDEMYDPLFDVKVELALSSGSQVVSPEVYAVCWTSSYQWLNNGSIWQSVYSQEQTFSTMLSDLSELIFPLYGTVSQNWSSSASTLLEIWNNSTQTAVIFVDPPDLGLITPSIGAVFATLENSSFAEVVSCSVYAGWQPTEIYTDSLLEAHNVYSPSLDNLLHLLDEGTGMDSPALADEGPRSRILQPIHIDSSWVDSALFPNETFVELVRLFSNIGFEEVDKEAGFGVSLSMLFADMLGRTSSKSEIAIGQQFYNETGTFMSFTGVDLYFDIGALGAPGQDLPPCTEFKVKAFRHGYAYSLEGFTRRAAAGILLFHIFVAVIYMFLVLWFGWSCHGLRSLIEILVLAISSTPSKKLDNSLCWRIDESDTYKHVVKVREVSRRRIGFVLGHDEDESSKMPAVGKTYGCLRAESVQEADGKDDVTEEVREVWSSS